MTKTQWVLDPTHSEIGFKIRHLMITNISGSFQEFESIILTEEDDFTTAQINVKLKTASIQTNNHQRDEHLRASDFFAADQYPEILFRSTKIVRQDDNSFEIGGDLTMKGITHPVKLAAEYNGIVRDAWGGQRAGFIISARINRSNWGISFNAVLETGGVALSDEVKISCEVQLVKQVVQVAA